MAKMFFCRNLVLGFALGTLLAIFFIHSNTNKTASVQTAPRPFSRPPKPHLWLKKHNLHRLNTPIDQIRYSNQSYLLESNFMRSKITIFCIVIVKKRKNVKAVEDTWGKSCNEIYFLDNSPNKTRKIPLKRDRAASTWVLLCKTLNLVPEGFEWVFVVNDHTFVVLENLRFLLAGLDSSKDYYLGHAVKFWGTVYNTAQAGFVMSRGVLRQIRTKIPPQVCTKAVTYMNREDYYLGKALMQSFNITASDSRDSHGLSIFHPYLIHEFLALEQEPPGIHPFPYKCCSHHSVTFQAVDGEKLYTYHYLLYTLQLFLSGTRGNQAALKPMEDADVWKRFLQERDVPVNITSEQYYKVWTDLIDDPASFARNMKRDEDSVDY